MKTPSDPFRQIQLISGQIAKYFRDAAVLILPPRRSVGEVYRKGPRMDHQQAVENLVRGLSTHADFFLSGFLFGHSTPRTTRIKHTTDYTNNV